MSTAPPRRRRSPKPVAVRVGGRIKTPARNSRVEPEHPAIAPAAQAEGLVILEAAIHTTGRVESVKVLRSGGWLDDAATGAVKRWRDSPLLLNGRPTPFVRTVTVRFHPGRRT